MQIRLVGLYLGLALRHLGIFTPFSSDLCIYRIYVYLVSMYAACSGRSLKKKIALKKRPTESHVPPNMKLFLFVEAQLFFLLGVGGGC